MNTGVEIGDSGATNNLTHLNSSLSTLATSKEILSKF